MTAVDPLVPLRILIVNGTLTEQQLAGEWMQRSVAAGVRRGFFRVLDGQIEVTPLGRDHYRALISPDLV